MKRTAATVLFHFHEVVCPHAKVDAPFNQF